MLLKSKVMISLAGAAVVTGITAPLVIKYGVTKDESVKQIAENIESAPNGSFESEEVVNYVLNEYAKTDKDQERESIDLASNKGEIEKFQQVVQKVKNRKSSDNQSLSKDDRDLLMDFYWMYSEWDPNKKIISSESSSVGQGHESINQYQHEFVADDLDQIQWDEDNLVLVKSGRESENWGWGEWSKNPFRHFYKDKGESGWKEKMRKIQSNKNQAELEIENDISSWLVNEIERIYKNRLNTR